MAFANIKSKPYDLVNSNQAGVNFEKFTTKDLLNHDDVKSLPNDLREHAALSSKYRLIYISAPTQKTGGFQFEVRVKNSLEFIVCLKAPSPMTPVTMAMSTPIALLTIPKHAHIVSQIKECPVPKD